MENTSTSKWDSYSTDELGSYLSDYHKEIHGFRPRYEGLYEDRARMIKMLDQLNSYMDRLRETFAGREQLRQEGWHIEETDPVYIQQAKWLKEEREREKQELDRMRGDQIREIHARAGRYGYV